MVEPEYSIIKMLKKAGTFEHFLGVKCLVSEQVESFSETVRSRSTVANAYHMEVGHRLASERISHNDEYLQHEHCTTRQSRCHAARYRVKFCPFPRNGDSLPSTRAEMHTLMILVLLYVHPAWTGSLGRLERPSLRRDSSTTAFVQHAVLPPERGGAKCFSEDRERAKSHANIPRAARRKSQLHLFGPLMETGYKVLPFAFLHLRNPDQNGYEGETFAH